MTLADVNVLVYAFRPDSPFHAQCRRWLTHTVQSGAPFGVSTLALAAVARISTTPKLRDGASTMEEAIAFCDAVLAQPNCRQIEPGPSHWPIFSRLCVEADVKGAMTTDAWYAALAIEHDCELITYDRDFARFSALRWRTPSE
jgi:uncharacterized protein